MRGGFDEAQLQFFVDTYLSRGGLARKLDRFFTGTVASVTNAAGGAPTTRPFACTITRLGEAAADGNTYLCSSLDYIPRVGDVVECAWRDEATGYVLWPLGGLGLPTTSGLGANVASAVLAAATASDYAGLLTVTAGGANITSGTQLCTVTFSKAFPIVPVITATGQSTVGLPGIDQVSKTGFHIWTNALISAGASATFWYRISTP